MPIEHMKGVEVHIIVNTNSAREIILVQAMYSVASKYIKIIE